MYKNLILLLYLTFSTNSDKSCKMRFRNIEPLCGLALSLNAL